jgi:hypothetical protein
MIIIVLFGRDASDAVPLAAVVGEINNKTFVIDGIAAAAAAAPLNDNNGRAFRIVYIPIIYASYTYIIDT